MNRLDNDGYSIVWSSSKNAWLLAKLDQLDVPSKELFINNIPDDKYNDVFKAIHCNDDEIAKMPPCYKATIIASFHNPIFNYYNTIAKVITPEDKSYFVSVPTFDKVLAGTHF